MSPSSTDRDTMPVLVVGVQGGIGSRLEQVLADAKHSVIGTTRRSSESSTDRIHLDLAQKMI